MALDFPSSPTVGQKYPASPVAGLPTYTWDGEKWMAPIPSVSTYSTMAFDVQVVSTR